MSSVPAVIAPPIPSPASRFGHWLRDGLRVWRRAPIMLVVLGLCSLLIEALLQEIPWVGIPISKVVVPMLAAGIWLGLDKMHRGDRLRFSCLWEGWRQPRWIALWVMSGLTGLLIDGFQSACAWLVYGHGVIDAVVFGHPQAHMALLTKGFQYMLILPGELPATLLMFAAPLFLFRGASVTGSIRESIRIVFAAPLAFGLLILLGMAQLAVCLANAWTVILLLPLMAWYSAVGYAVWLDVGKEPLADVSA